MGCGQSKDIQTTDSKKPISSNNNIETVESADQKPKEDVTQEPNSEHHKEGNSDGNPEQPNEQTIEQSSDIAENGTVGDVEHDKPVEKTPSADDTPADDTTGNDVNSQTTDKQAENPLESQEPSQDTSWSEFELAALKAHNIHREKHSAPPLELNRELCDMAQKWANHLADHDLFEHSDRENRKYKGWSAGENLAWSSSKTEASTLVQMWYDELEKYDFTKQGFSSETGHFTQVVWKSSSELGIGIANGICVANYYPPGNVGGGFEDNVEPAKE